MLVDEIVASAGDSGFPLDRDCVAAIVGQLSDEDLAIVREDIANAGDVAVADSGNRDGVHGRRRTGRCRDRGDHGAGNGTG